MDKNQKKYFVSLALKVPANFEVEISAENKEEAYHKALELFDSGKYESRNITEPDWNNLELDAEGDDIDDLSSGIFIEER